MKKIIVCLKVLFLFFVICINQLMANSFSIADLEGTWAIYAFGGEEGLEYNLGWIYGSLTFNSNGILTSGN